MKMNEELSAIVSIAEKCLKRAKNRLYFSYRALSPAIYRLPAEYDGVGTGLFGTDAEKVVADPMGIILAYKQSPEKLERMYLHMLFHCIYLHPFTPMKDGLDPDIWNLAMDICSEAAVLRLDTKDFDGKNSLRSKTVEKVSSNVKMLLPELVYRELDGGGYDIQGLSELFQMDTHLWMQDGNGQGNGGASGQSGSNRNSKGKGNGNGNGQDPQKDPGNGNDGGDGQDSQDDKNGDGGGNGNNDGQPQQDNGQPGGGQPDNNKPDNSHNGRPRQGSGPSQQKKQEWGDVARRIAADMQSFHRMGKDPGSMSQEIDYLTQDRMEYGEFLRQFSIMEEKMKVDMDEFDYMYYSYGLSMPGAKKKLLIEPLEYKDEKVVKDFVIAIDTSGSCSGDLVQRFLRKTYSILKESESFSSRMNVHIIQCDASIQKDTKITNADDLDRYMQHMQLFGFGGTDFRPVFEYVDKLQKEGEFENLCGLIYFTDGYGVYPTKPTPYKTAFAFLEDYEYRDNIPPWAMSVYWDDSQE